MAGPCGELCLHANASVSLSNTQPLSAFVFERQLVSQMKDINGHTEKGIFLSVLRFVSFVYWFLVS